MIVLALSCLIFFVSGLIQGLTGFGGGLVAIPLLCLIMDAKLAVPLAILNGTIIATSMTIGLRRTMERRKILPMLIGSLPGVLAGTFLLKVADPVGINRAMGIMLIAISAINLTFKPRPLNPHVFWGYTAGFFSGAISASVGAGGPPVILYATSTDWKKNEIKATLTGFFMLNSYITVAVHAFSGVITRDILISFALTLGFVLLGTQAGSALSGRINRQGYLQIIYLLLIVLGAVMLIR